MPSNDVLTVTVTMEPRPMWQWAWSVPRGLVRRFKFVDSGPWYMRLLTAAYLGTRRVKIGGKTC